MNIILLGPQGSGKSTQAELLTRKYKLKHISSGDLIRHPTDPDAKKIKEETDQGKLAPDEWVIKLIHKNLNQKNLLDGVPRTLPQAEGLDKLIHIDAVIELTLTDEEAVKRISTRKHCSKCGKIYGPNTTKCECGGELITRKDDTPEAVKKRLKTYRDQTEPLLEYYRPRNIVHKTDASKTVEEIFKELCTIIDTLQ